MATKAGWGAAARAGAGEKEETRRGRRRTKPDQRYGHKWCGGRRGTRKRLRCAHHLRPAPKETRTYRAPSFRLSPDAEAAPADTPAVLARILRKPPATVPYP
jgi:hypothetical protein